MLKKLFVIAIIPSITLIIVLMFGASRGISLFGSEGNWITFLRAVATVMLTTFALSINLNSGRFDFSIGAVSLLSSVISAKYCIENNLSTEHMIIISIVAGLVFGMISGVIYIITKLPPIIVSLGMAMFYEGLAFTLTKGYGVSFVINKELTSFPSIKNYLVVIFISLILVIIIFDYTKFGLNYKALVSGQKVAVDTGINEKINAVLCYGISGALMGMVGFIAATNTGSIQMALRFGSIGIMFTAFLPMFIGGFIARQTNEKIGYLLGAISTSLISLAYARFNTDSSIQQIITAFILVGFLIYLNNEKKILEVVTLKRMIKNKMKKGE